MLYQDIFDETLRKTVVKLVQNKIYSVEIDPVEAGVLRGMGKKNIKSKKKSKKPNLTKKIHFVSGNSERGANYHCLPKFS